MAYVADLHIHSRFSRACSQEITLPNLAKWGKLKGIDLLGTGDFLHPLWYSEIKRYLIESPTGTHILKPEFEDDSNKGVKFLLTLEISCIYSDKGKLRRIHILVFLPSFSSVENLSKELIKRGANLASDGRPILGMSAKALCEVVWGIEKRAIIIPAHIWTPWFSLFGSESGYDFLKECFEEYSDQILAVETGLSSEPSMNWRISELDNLSIVSFSDAHSLPKLGREVTLFKGNPTFDELKDDLQTQNLVGTIEFFPEEGKYHYSGHRNCNIVYSPKELLEKGEICPVCKRRLTIGVMTRVEELATRTEDDLQKELVNGIITSKTYPSRPGFRMLVSLDGIISEAFGVATTSQKVKNEYLRLVTNLDSELKILTKLPLDLIEMVAGERIADGVKRVREGRLSIEPGFDNTYGKVSIWDEETDAQIVSEQVRLF